MSNLAHRADTGMVCGAGGWDKQTASTTTSKLTEYCTTHEAWSVCGAVSYINESCQKCEATMGTSAHTVVHSIRWDLQIVPGHKIERAVTCGKKEKRNQDKQHLGK